MADKLPPKGFLEGLAGALGEAAKVFGTPKTPKATPAAHLLGEPVRRPTDPALDKQWRERNETRWNFLTPDQAFEARNFLGAMPMGAEVNTTHTRTERFIQLPWVHVGMTSSLGARAENQDRGVVNPMNGLQAVCDGMDKKGALASSTAADLIRQYFDASNASATLQSTVRATAKDDSLPSRLRALGGIVHREIRKRVDATGKEVKGGTTVAGIVVEGDQAYSFHKGDSMNLIVREGKVVFCTRPMSRLQQAVERLRLPLYDTKTYIEDWVDHTELDEIFRVLPELTGQTDTQKIKSLIAVDPGRVLGWTGDEKEDLIVGAFQLLPGDTLVSMSDGGSDAFGIRIIPTKMEDGQPVFDAEYDSDDVYGHTDPLRDFAATISDSTSDTITAIQNQISLRGTGDNATVVVTRFKPELYEKPVPPPVRGGFGPVVGEDTNPFGPLTPVSVLPPAWAVLTDPVVRPTPPPPTFEPPAPRPIPTPRPVREPVPVIPPPPAPPAPEALRSAADIVRLEGGLRRLALDYDAAARTDDEIAADYILGRIWDTENRLAVLRKQPKPKRDGAIERRIRLNGYRFEIDQAEASRISLEDEYRDWVDEKRWELAQRALEERHDAGLQRRTFGLLLAWEEARFADLMGEVVELRNREGVQVLKVARILPADHPRTPNLVVMQVLDDGGNPSKQVALPAEQWQQKIHQGTELVVTRGLYPLKADDLVREATTSVEKVRLIFNGTQIAKKLDAGQFDAQPELKEHYLELRRLFQRAVPSSPDVSAYISWVDQVERVSQKIERLTKPK